MTDTKTQRNGTGEKGLEWSENRWIDRKKIYIVRGKRERQGESERRGAANNDVCLFRSFVFQL